MKFESLAGFLSGYLHQDWDLDYTGAEEAVREFASTSTEDSVLKALGELTVLLASDRSEYELEQYLKDASCYYRPIDSTIREWLNTLAYKIAKTAALAGAKGPPQDNRDCQIDARACEAPFGGF